MNNALTPKRSKTFFIVMLLYKMLLDILYIFFVSQDYKFYHFLDAFNWPLYIVSWVLMVLFLLLIFFTIKRKGIRFSTIFLLCIFSLSGVPFLSFLYAGYDFQYVISNIIYWLVFLLAFLITGLIQKNGNKSYNSYVGHDMLRSSAIHFIGLFFCLVVFAVSFFYSGLRLSFNMDMAYSYRSEAAVASMPALLGYLYQWSRLIIPFCLSYALLKKKYLLALVYFFFQLLNFGFDGMRLTVLITALAFVIPFLYRARIIRRASVFILIPLTLSFLMAASIVEHLAFGSGEIDRVITFRTFFLPNLIESWFFDFFKSNEPDFFRSGILRYFGFSSPYSSLGIDYIISGVYFGDYAGRANSGMIADAITNFGNFGIIAMPIIIAIWALICDRCFRRISLPLVLLVSIYFGYCFTNNFLMIILFTNGGFIVPLFVFIASRSKRGVKVNSSLCQINFKDRSMI